MFPTWMGRKAAELATDREKMENPQAFKALLTSTWRYAVKKKLNDIQNMFRPIYTAVFCTLCTPDLSTDGRAPRDVQQKIGM